MIGRGGAWRRAGYPLIALPASLKDYSTKMLKSHMEYNLRRAISFLLSLREARMNPDLLLTTSLRDAQAGASVSRILAAGLDAVDPAAAVRARIDRPSSIGTGMVSPTRGATAP